MGIADPALSRPMGFDDTVRKYLKKDEHIVLAVLGMYAGIIGLVKIKSSLSKKPVPAPIKAAPVAVAAVGTAESKWGFEFPTMENFDAWGENDENWKKWETFMEGKFDEWLVAE